MESGLQDSKSDGLHGRFMYGDYSPLEDDRNLIDMIKEFVALTSKIGRLDADNKKLAALVSDSDRLRQDIVAAIKNIKTNTAHTMEKFQDEHSDILSNDLVTKGAALLMDTKNSLSELLSNTETGFDEQHTKYREKITAKIGENNNTASSLIQAWLASDHRTLPRPILSNLVTTVTAALDRKTDKNYIITRSVASSASATASAKDSMQFSYSFRIDPTEVEFWNFRRTVKDLGVKELLLPVGMKAPVSEKIKQTFRLRKDAEVMKEPEFVKADDYFITSVLSQGDKLLTLELARDPSGDDDSFRITYDVSNAKQVGTDSAKPKIDYIWKDGAKLETEFDLLQVAEIARNSDLSKIGLVGAAVLSEIRTLQDPELAISRGKLGELKIHSDTVVIPTSLEKGQYSSLFQFLESIARSYAPFVAKMWEKTQVDGELTLREELGGGQRKEYSARVDDLKSQLKDTESSKSVASALGFEAHKAKN